MDAYKATDLTGSIVEKESTRQNDPPWVSEVKRRSSELFHELEWPTMADEEWRRTDLSKIDFGRYGVKTNDGAGFSEEGLLSYHVPEGLRKAGCRLIPLNSVQSDPGWGGIENIDLVRGLLNVDTQGIDNKLLAWHFGLWTVGAVISVPEGFESSDPIIVDYKSSGSEEYIAPHTIIVLGRGAKASVIQKFDSSGGTDSLWNVGLQASLSESARLSLSSIQRVGKSDTFVHHGNIHLAENADLSSFEAFIGGGLCKTRTQAYMDGPGSSASLQGMFIADAGQHMDIRTVQYHKSHHTQSRALYKGAVKDGGRTVYQGLIDVEPEAVGTDAYLTNKNLILHGDDSESSKGIARADSIPSLKIRTNDVKCSHGSTTGKLDEEQLFYLMARGIPRAEARKELAIGFFEEMMGTAAPEVREELSDSVLEQIS